MKFNDVRLKGFNKYMKVDQALDLVTKSFPLFQVEQLSLKDNQIINRILRENITAKRSIPPFDRSAVDGYAVKAEDTFSASETNPMLLQVIDSVNIGERKIIKMEKGTAVLIPTGAVVPDDANAVIMVEDTNKLDNNYIEVIATIHPGKNISRIGEDVQEKDLLFQTGRKLRSVDRGFLLSAGVQAIKVTKTPSIAIISTGDELQEPWQDLTEAKIPDVNGINLIDLCNDENWKTSFIGIIKDDKEKLSTQIIRSTQMFDIIMVSGGTSVGKKDLIPVILHEQGEIYFHGLAMRPGGPVLCGKINNKIVFGLPGFPTATIIAFRFIIKPIIENLLGIDSKENKYTIKAIISRNVASKLGRRDFLRVIITKNENGMNAAEPIQIGGSGILKNIVEADGFVQILENSEGLKEGDEVDVQLF